TIDRPASALAILVPSMTASDLRVEFGTGSGTGFAPLVKADGLCLGLCYHAASSSARLREGLCARALLASSRQAGRVRHFRCEPYPVAASSGFTRRTAARARARASGVAGVS